MESACGSLHFRGLKVTSLTKINKGSLLWLIGCRNSKETVCNTEFIPPTQPQTGSQSCTLTCTFRWWTHVRSFTGSSLSHTQFIRISREKESWYLFDKSGLDSFCRQACEKDTRIRKKIKCTFFFFYSPVWFLKGPIFTCYQDINKYPDISHHFKARVVLLSSLCAKAFLPSDLCLVAIG